MRALVLYATQEGQTRKIAHYVADRLTQAGVLALAKDASDGDPDWTDVGAVIVAAPVHLESYPAPIRRAVERNRDKIAALPNVFISVSLSAAGDDPDDWRGLAKCVTAFAEETGWTPQQVVHAAGAFRYTKYDYFKRWMLQRIAKERGAPADVSADWELTDWAALAAFADGFAAKVRAA